MQKSTMQLLIEHRYGPTLQSDIEAMIEDGLGWRAMAKVVSKHADYPLSYEALRQWYGPQAEQAAKAMRDAKAKANTTLPLDDDVPDSVATAV